MVPAHKELPGLLLELFRPESKKWFHSCIMKQHMEFRKNFEFKETFPLIGH
jgi:hypothetical protein